MTIGVTAEVEYNAHRGMWKVTIYRNGAWQDESWFFSEMVARQWAAEVEATR